MSPLTARKDNSTGNFISRPVNQSRSHMTSISENEMNTLIPLCNVHHLNEILT